MKRTFYVLIAVWLLFTGVAWATGGGKGKKHEKSCDENDFSTRVIEAKIKDNGCIRYTLEVTHDGRVSHALSHYTVAVSCGKVYNVTNSEGWKIEYGHDKKTNLTEFKVDDIPNFGETRLKKFTVSFTVCQDNGRHCATKEGCCYPIVAYKAGQCVYYDKLEGACPMPPDDPPASELKASLEIQQIDCHGNNNGSLLVKVEQGKEPYTYVWSTGATTPGIEGLAAGNYEVTVKDAAGSELKLSATITEPEALQIAGTVTSEGCGNGNGAIDITVSGGTAPYTYQWSNDQTTEDLADLHAGDYTVIVTDAKGCTATKSFEILNQNQLTVTLQSTLPACGQKNGSITVTVSGGTEPYTYTWSNGATTKDLTNIGAGTYTVTVKDANGCSAQRSLNIKENNTLKLTWVVSQTSCLDDGSGAIDLTVEGGTAPYTYTWDTGQTTEDISGLTEGVYRVTVTDAAGCEASAVMLITKKSFVVNAKVTQPACDGSYGGSIELFPANTGETYTYQWSHGPTTSSLYDLEPGTYTVRVTDGTGCFRDIPYVILEPSGITATATVTNTQCNAEGAFNIDLTVNGGTGPYTYEWSNGSTTQDLTGVNSGIYTVTITDAGGCTTTHEVEVTGTPPTWSCTISPSEDEVICSSTGNILNSAVAGADSYQWSVTSTDNQWTITSGAGASSVTYTAGGPGSTATFTLTATMDGCTQTCEYVVTTCKSDEEEPGEEPGEPGEEPDGEDPGQDPGEDPNDPGENPQEPGGGNESCEDCLWTEVVSVDRDGNCTTYTMQVNTNGACRYELSHWTIAIPCGKPKYYSNSEGWKMEYGKDPTTGLYGLKVDDIDDFGKTPDSFTVTFTICAYDYGCKDELSDWKPKVGYKAGQCVAYDRIDIDDEVDEDPDGPICKAYPNPYVDRLCFEWTADKDDDVWLDLLDMNGNHVKSLYCGKVYRGERYKVECGDLTKSMYIYRFKSRHKTSYGKICKIR
jgi:hypothetical protein